MLSPRRRPKNLSLSERVERGDDIGLDTSTDADYICQKCFDQDVISWTYTANGVTKCVTCDYDGPRLPRSIVERTPAGRGEYERELVRRLQMTNGTALVPVRKQREIVRFQEEEIARARKNIMQSLVLPKEITNPVEREAASQILAEFQVVYGLNAHNNEVQLIKFNNQWVAYIGYKGWGAIARKEDEKAGRRRNFGKHEVETEHEVEKSKANLCKGCNGTGTCSKCKGAGVTSWDGKDKACYNCKAKAKEGDKVISNGICPSCKGEKKHPAGEIISVKIPLYDPEDKMSMEKARLEYEPTWGYAVWQPGDNWAGSRSPLWQAIKNARNDAYRQEYSLNTMMVGGQTVTLDDKAEYVDTEVADVEEEFRLIETQIKTSGVQYEEGQLDDFISYLRSVLDASSAFSSEGAILDAMNEIEIAYSKDSVPLLRILLHAYSEGSYPITHEVMKMNKPLPGYFHKLARHDAGKASVDIDDVARTTFGKELKELSRVQYNNLMAILHAGTTEDEARKEEMISWS